MITVANWSDLVGRSSGHVNPDIKTGKTLLNSTLIVVGARQHTADGERIGTPPTINDFNAIGVVQTAQIQQNKKLIQLFELGSYQSYIIPGRTIINANLGRLLIDGDSLIGSLYPIGPDELETTLDFGEYPNFGFTFDGNKTFIINLASEFLNKPTDIMFALFDGEYNFMGAFYLEDAYVYQHNISFASDRTVLVENVGLLACSMGVISG